MFVPDANLVLNLLKHKNRHQELPDSYLHYLTVTRRQVGREWHERQRMIPVNPTYAALELSKFGQESNRSRFDGYFYDFLQGIHGIGNIAPEWVNDCFETATRPISQNLPSLAKMFEKALGLVPSGDTATDAQIELACQSLFGWAEAEKVQLSVTGGPSFYVAVYAIAGSPDARRIMKVTDARKRGAREVAWNVAWDFVYLHHQEHMYLCRTYKDTIFCTADDALATLLASKVSHGPRYLPALAVRSTELESFGDLVPFKFRRLGPGTQLGSRLAKAYGEMLERVASTTPGVIAIGGHLPIRGNS